MQGIQFRTNARNIFYSFFFCNCYLRNRISFTVLRCGSTPVSCPRRVAWIGNHERKTTSWFWSHFVRFSSPWPKFRSLLLPKVHVIQIWSQKQGELQVYILYQFGIFELKFMINLVTCCSPCPEFRSTRQELQVIRIWGVAKIQNSELQLT